MSMHLCDRHREEIARLKVLQRAAMRYRSALIRKDHYPGKYALLGKLKREIERRERILWQIYNTQEMTPIRCRACHFVARSLPGLDPIANSLNTEVPDAA